MVTLIKLLQSLNATSPIASSPSDSVTDVRPLSLKAKSPIVTTPVKSALIKLLHPLKASFGISSPAGNLIPLIFPLFTYVFSVV